MDLNKDGVDDFLAARIWARAKWTTFKTGRALACLGRTVKAFRTLLSAGFLLVIGFASYAESLDLYSILRSFIKDEEILGAVVGGLGLFFGVLTLFKDRATSQTVTIDDGETITVAEVKNGEATVGMSHEGEIVSESSESEPARTLTIKVEAKTARGVG